MALRTPDLTDFLVADLPRGRVESSSGGTRLLALPSTWVAELVSRAPDDAVDLSRSLALDLARDARAWLQDLPDPSAEECAHALSLSMATRGLGLCHFERYGDALSLHWTDPPSSSAAFSRFAAALCAHALSSLTELDVNGAVLLSSPAEIRVFLGSRDACALASELSSSGGSQGAIFDRLSPGASA